MYRADESTVEQLFAASPLPAVSRMGTGSSPINSTFQKYKASLQRQMCGRTAMLDEIIGPLERHAEGLNQDFSRIASHDDASSRLRVRLVTYSQTNTSCYRPLAEELREAYQPDADALCLELIGALESASKELISQPGKFPRCATHPTLMGIIYRRNEPSGLYRSVGR